MDFACILKNGRKRDLELAKTSLELVEMSNCSRGMHEESWYMFIKIVSWDYNVCARKWFLWTNNNNIF